MMKCSEQLLIDGILHQLRGSTNTVFYGGIYHLNWISTEPGFQRTQNYHLDHHGGFPQRTQPRSSESESSSSVGAA